MKKATAVALRAVITVRWHHFTSEAPCAHLRIHIVGGTNREPPYGGTLPTKCGEIFVRDLGFTSYLTAGRVPSGEELDYRDVHCADRRETKAMHGSMVRIERRLAALAKRFGHVRTMPEFFVGVCDVLGVVEVVITPEVHRLAGKPDDERTVPVLTAKYVLERAIEHTCAEKESVAS